MRGDERNRLVCVVRVVCSIRGLHGALGVCGRESRPYLPPVRPRFCRQILTYAFSFHVLEVYFIREDRTLLGKLAATDTRSPTHAASNSSRGLPRRLAN